MAVTEGSGFRFLTQPANCCRFRVSESGKPRLARSPPQAPQVIPFSQSPLTLNHKPRHLRVARLRKAARFRVPKKGSLQWRKHIYMKRCIW